MISASSSTVRDLGRPALAAGLMVFLAVSAAAQVGRSGLIGTAVDEGGETMADVEITLQPVGETAGRIQLMKTDRRGRFSNRFLSSGRYIVDVQQRGRFFIKSAKVKVTDAGGILLAEYEITSHPKEGLASIPIQGGQITEVRLVITSATTRERLLRQVEGGAVQGEVSELVRLLNAGELEQALALGRQLMQAAGAELPDLLHLVGMTYARLDRHAEAEPLLRRAVELAPDQAEFAASLGTMLLRVARHKDKQTQDAKAAYVEAEVWLGKAVKTMNSPPVSLLTNHSIALEGAGRADAALEVMERIATRDPGDIAVRLRMAALLRARGQAKRALEVLNTIPGGGDTRTVNSLYNVAVTFFNAEDYESALAALKRAEELNANHGEVQRLLGRLYYIAGDQSSAMRHLRRFLELEPNHPEAEAEREMVRYLERMTKQNRR